jgi:hypothetical protein
VLQLHFSCFLLQAGLPSLDSGQAAARPLLPCQSLLLLLLSDSSYVCTSTFAAVSQVLLHAVL